MESSSNELALIQYLARTSEGLSNGERIRSLLNNGIDWGYLFRTANKHRLDHLLFPLFSHGHAEFVPKNQMERFRKAYQSNKMRSMFLTGELIKLLRLFESNGIQAIPFKGPVLAAFLYGDIARRAAGDLDILILKRELAAIKNLLLAQGYELRLNRAQEKFYLQNKFHFHFTHGKHNAIVEIHWAFTRKHWHLPLTFEWLSNRQKKVCLNGHEVYSFLPEDLLIVLCVHGFKHFWSRLAWICDVAELINANKVSNWDVVMGNAIKWGCQRIIYFGLSLAHDLLDAKVPEEILYRSQNDSVVTDYVEQTKKWLWEEGNPSLEFHTADAYYLKLRERLRDRIPYLSFRFRQLLYDGIISKLKQEKLVVLHAD